MNRFVLMISKSISVIGAMTWKEYMIWISGACCIISKRCVILDVSSPAPTNVLEYKAV